jgi:hypothetical protein
MNEKMLQDKLASCKSLLDIQVVSMTNILEKQLILNEINEMVKANPALQQNNLFWEWFFANYVDGQIMELMRILDQDQGSKNLFRFIDSLLQGQQADNTFFTRIREQQISASSLPREMVEQLIPLFEESSLEADKQLLLKKSEEIKKYRDSVIAHSDPKKRSKINLTFTEVNALIELLHNKILDYILRLNGSGYLDTGLLPTIAYDWKSIFRIPWSK